MSVCFGHTNWNLVLNMMIGIRKSLNHIFDDIIFTPLNYQDYKKKSRFDIFTYEYK
jgi:hypothetical protein